MTDTLAGEGVDQVARIADQQEPSAAQWMSLAGEWKAHALNGTLQCSGGETILQGRMRRDEPKELRFEIHPAVAHHIAAQTQAYIGTAAGQWKDPQVTGQQLLEKVQFDETVRIEALYAAIVRAHPGRMVAWLRGQTRHMAREVRVGTIGRKDQLAVDG